MEPEIFMSDDLIKNKRIWVKETIENAFKADKLEPALEAVVKSLVSLYPQSKIWIAERYGKRESFIAGSGKESYHPAKKISITDCYNLFLQDFPEKSRQEIGLIVAIFKIVIISYS